jgi:hypothetical protein
VTVSTAKGEGRNGRSGIGADSRQLLQRSFILGEAAAHRGHRFCAGEQIARAGIIAEPGPGGHHITIIGSGKRGDTWPARRKPPKIWFYRGHGRLLEHDFRKPNPIRPIGIRKRQNLAWRVAPGQNARIDIKPAQNPVGKCVLGSDGHGALWHEMRR